MGVRVGIIGTGIMGADHANTLHRFVSGGSVALLADVDLARAEATAAPLGCRVSDDPDALITDPSVDAVIVASHDSTHAEFVRACAAAGKPVLCEKPLAPSLAEAAALIAELGDAADLVSLGFMRRFDPGYAALRAAIQARTMGEPVLLHSVGRGVSSGPGSTSESSVTNSAIHDLDIVAWLLDSPVVEVSWHAGRHTSQVAQPALRQAQGTDGQAQGTDGQAQGTDGQAQGTDGQAQGTEGQAQGTVGFQDPQFFLLRTADGVLSTVETFLNARYGYDIRCEVVGEAGTASLVEPARLVTDTTLTRGQVYAADWRPRFADAYRLELQSWIDSLTGGDRGPLATARDGLLASNVADAVIRSMHHGGATTAVRAI